jgi:hypothetical protein
LCRLRVGRRRRRPDRPRGRRGQLFPPRQRQNGELAITVAADWRGWLGPYLLDVLLGAAAERNVPNLEAEILVENRRMLALMRRRGYATVDGTDFSTFRVAVSTSGATPSWPGPHDRPRLLAEVPGGRWRGERAVRQTGVDVMVCQLPRGPGHADELRAAHAAWHTATPVLVPGPPAAPLELQYDPGGSDHVLLGVLERVLIDRRARRDRRPAAP